MTLATPVIVGGGPAGAAAAIHLLRAGARPLIVERRNDRADPLCGGFLSWQTLEQLAALGLTAESLGGQRLGQLRVFARGRAHAWPLPAPAMAVSRRVLDRQLLARAQAMGAEVRQGVAVYENGRLRLGGDAVLGADPLFLATGKHDLHGLARPRAAAGSDPMLGLRLRLPASPALAEMLDGCIELHLFPGGYLGAVLQEDGSANFCMAVRKSTLTAAGGRTTAMFRQLAGASPALAARLADLPPTPRIDAVAHIPYGWRATTGERGIFRLGDQAGVIPSLAGEGIGVALASAALAVDFWSRGGSVAAPAYQRAFAARLRRPFLAAGMVAAIGTHPSAAFPLRLLAAVPGSASLIARLTRV